jgi:hypothetical protein
MTVQFCDRQKMNSNSIVPDGFMGKRQYSQPGQAEIVSDGILGADALKSPGDIPGSLHGCLF